MSNNKPFIINRDLDLILASNSKIRKKILSDLKLEFRVVKPDFDEEVAKQKIKHLSVKEQALYLARNKALSVSKKYPGSIVIGSDQICQISGSPGAILSKSKDINDAVEQLKKINGKIHYQNNAICLCRDKIVLFEHFEKAKLKMHKLSLEEIKNYARIDRSWGCAGSYKFESLGRYLFSGISGNFDCVLGMAMQKTISFLFKKKLINFRLD